MPASYFERFVRESVEGYSRDAIAAGRWPATEAEANSRAELDRFLPEGVQTPGHHVCLVETGGFEEPVGTLWYGEMERERQQIAYVFDLRIYPEFRRRGHAASALGEVELFARMRNLAAIGLHVFAHNEPARALYDKLGYRSERGLMFKRLSHGG